MSYVCATHEALNAKGGGMRENCAHRFGFALASVCFGLAFGSLAFGLRFEFFGRVFKEPRW